MKKFAVGIINFFDNVMKIEVVEAEDWRTALKKHSNMWGEEDEDIDEDMEKAKQNFFNSDGMFDVVEIL